MKLSTATTFDESKYEVLGIVMGMETRSISFLRELFADIKATFGGKNNIINSRFLKARESALEELAKNAEAMGADMVVAIDIDTETMSLDTNNVFTFVATGTALKRKFLGGKKSKRRSKTAIM